MEAVLRRYRGLLRSRFEIRQWPACLTDLGLIAAGSIIFAVGMNAVMLPNRFLAGGLAGLAMILRHFIPSVDVGWFYLALNIPLAVLGWYHISHRFMVYTVFGIAFFSLTAVQLKPAPFAISDPILAALWGGLICGLGAGLILRSAGSAGGLDILAVYLKKKYELPIGTVVFGANASVLLAGAYLFSLQAALYSIVLLFVSSRVVDLVLNGMSGRKTIMVISDRAEAIADELLCRQNRGVTYLKGEGAYSRQDKQVIFSVTNQIELPKVKEIILRQDPNAFIVVNDANEVIGTRYCPSRSG